MSFNPFNHCLLANNFLDTLLLVCRHQLIARHFGIFRPSWSGVSLPLQFIFNLNKNIELKIFKLFHWILFFIYIYISIRLPFRFVCAFQQYRTLYIPSTFFKWLTARFQQSLVKQCIWMSTDFSNDMKCSNEPISNIQTDCSLCELTSSQSKKKIINIAAIAEKIHGWRWCPLLISPLYRTYSDSILCQFDITTWLTKKDAIQCMPKSHRA